MSLIERMLDAERLKDGLAENTRDLNILRWLLAEQAWKVTQVREHFHEQVDQSIQQAREAFGLALEVAQQAEDHSRSVVEQTAGVVNELAAAHQTLAAQFETVRWLHAEAKHYWDVWRSLYFERKAEQ